ncbi:glycosyltransferase [Crocosphaera sp. XPORK-15E]|uniref:glycosyltransferase n=1 Tax=Crocosphaera sp. XPORK-15E TaxID=3110247 RepID=UPI002B210810|nr:glycosyltransferase [Crocosphaera sp. XPORK-15E]MEA5536458.1 glycosyltransferase [Crocosphaera sp. XPORK-15E]
MFKQAVQGKIVKFFLGGSLSAFLNIILMIVLIERLGFDSPTLRNIANIISMEISLIAGFFIYRLLVWTGGSWNLHDVLLKQLPLYHISATAAILSRILIVFPILDWLKVNYVINTLIGVLVSFTFNYVISDRLIFRYPSSLGKKAGIDNINYPEGLSPVLSNYSRSPSTNSPGSSQPIGKFSIVIPAYNEEGCIVSTVTLISQTLEKVGISYEILVVNDNSRDRTEELLQQLNAQNPKVRYINNYYPNGFGFAVRCGLENFSGDAVAIVMADNSDSPENMIDYYQKLQEGYDCVFGSRFIKGGKVVDYPIHKLIVNRLANWFVQVLFGLPLNDTTNAFKAYRKEVIEGISPLLSHHFNLTVEIPLKAITRGYYYCIIPITWRNRTTGVSKLKLKEMGSRYLFIVLSILLEKHLSRGDYVKKQTPLVGQSKNN